MKESIKKIAKFLHLVDESGQCDLTDLAFICIMIKIMIAASVDWPSMVTFATVTLNKMHRRHNGSKDGNEEDLQDLEAISGKVDKIEEIKEKVQEVVK